MADFPPVLILSGGLGTRVRSVDAALPKALLPVNGEPFVAHQLRLLAREGVTDVILCVGYRCAPLVEYVGNGEDFGINVRYSYDNITNGSEGKNVEEKLLGTGGAILQASAGLGIPFAVLYGDSYLDTQFAPIFAAFEKANKLGMMTVFENNNQWIPSNILCQSGMIISYDKKLPTSEMRHVDYGLSIFYPQAFAAFRHRESFDLVEVFLSLKKARQLAAYEVQERFYETGSPEGIKELEKYLALCESSKNST